MKAAVTETGLTPTEEAQLARECLRLGPWPREVVLTRNGRILTIYNLPTRKAAARLLRTLGIGDESNGTA